MLLAEEVAERAVLGAVWKGLLAVFGPENSGVFNMQGRVIRLDLGVSTAERAATGVLGVTGETVDALEMVLLKGC